MVRIRGIEVTQAIQYYQSHEHLTDPADRGADNSVRLIAYKPAWVRVYVESETDRDTPNVTGELTITYGQLNQRSGPPLKVSPQGPGVITALAYPDYRTVRSSRNATLNFIIPRSRMSGPLVLKVEVSIGSGAVSATKSMTIWPTLLQRLKVRGIMVGYNGPQSTAPSAPNIIINPPTLAELQRTASWALRVMPVSSSALVEAVSTITESTPLTGNVVGGVCPASWFALNDRINDARLADGNRTDYIYYGLLPATFPNEGNGGGCNAQGVAVGFVGGQMPMAHEITHNCGILHAPCGDVAATVDPNYPAYEPYETPAAKVASIGEFGLDISTGNIPTPDVARDYMSYCPPFWISLYNYSNLMNNPRLNPEIVGTLPRWWEDHGLYDPFWFLHYNPGYPPPYWFSPEVFPEPRMRNVIAITGTRDTVGRVNVTHVVRTQVFSEELPGSATELMAYLMGASGDVLASAQMRASVGQAACGCTSGASDKWPCLQLLTAFVPDTGSGVAIVIKEREVTVWERRAPIRPVEVRDLRAKRSRGGLVAISWRVDWPDREKGHCWLRYSTDAERTWKCAAVDLRGERATIDAANLPRGRILLQVSAHDGFYSAHSKPAVFVNEAHPPSLVILHPTPGRSLVEGETLHLWGSAAGQPGISEDDFDFVWLIDGKQIGDELEMFAVVPKPGRHIAKLQCRGRGGRIVGTTEVEFKAVQRGGRPRRGRRSRR